jgi:hypothetical protein
VGLGLQLAELQNGEVFRIGNMGSQELVQLPVKPVACSLEGEGKLEVLCWCDPLPCHAEVVRGAVLWLAGGGGWEGEVATRIIDEENTGTESEPQGIEGMVQLLQLLLKVVLSPPVMPWPRPAVLCPTAGSQWPCWQSASSP